MLRSVAVGLTILLAMGATSGSASASPGDTASPPTSDTVVSSHFYGIQKRLFQLPSSTPWVTALRGNEVLALGRDSGTVGGLLGGDATAYPLYSFDAGHGSYRALGDIDFLPIVGLESRLRVLDFQYLPELQSKNSKRVRALVSIAAYSAQTRCRRLYVNEVLIDLSGAGSNALGKRWFTLPCIRPFTPTDGGLVGPVLHQSGGRLTMVPKKSWRKAAQPEIYVTTGDFALLANLGARLKPGTRKLLSGLLAVSADGSVSRVAGGMRNPQGLTRAQVDGRAAVFATSHGPRGGDVLLDIRPGDDYGWPRESYGTVYSYKPTPLQSKPKLEGRRPSATKPAFSWVPSIGPSSVIQVNGRAFRQWWGMTPGRPTADLLVSGMGAKTLNRIRWEDGAVRYVEVIDVDQRMRSLAQTPGGVVVAGTDGGQVMVLSPSTAWSSSASEFR